MLVLYFGDQADDSALLRGTDLGPDVESAAVLCVRVPRPAAPAAAVAAAASLLPAPRLAQPDLWAAYGVKEADTFVVTDRYGNESRRTTGSKLASAVRGVTGGFKALRAKVKTDTEAALQALQAEDTDTALKAMRKACRHDLTGYEECVALADAYSKLLEKGRAAVKLAGRDRAALQALAGQWQGTEVQPEIEAALASLDKG